MRFRRLPLPHRALIRRAPASDARRVGRNCRKLSEPLKPAAEVEAAHHAPRPADVEPIAAKRREAAEERAPEPSLFETYDDEIESEPQRDTYYDDAPAAQQDDDGLPPPAYRPRVEEFQPRADALEAKADDYVAPRSSAPGTPSADAAAAGVTSASMSSCELGIAFFAVFACRTAGAYIVEESYVQIGSCAVLLWGCVQCCGYGAC